jgi:hypothetical protein
MEALSDANTQLPLPFIADVLDRCLAVKRAVMSV